MQKDQLASFLKLFHVNGIGRVTLYSLHDRFDGDYNRMLDASRDELKSSGLQFAQIEQIKNTDFSLVDNDLSWAEKTGNKLICFDDELYPELLKQIIDYPPLLYCSGKSELLHNPQIAIVGSRNCSPGGARTAREFSALLAESGLTITSGLAQGIDTHAHLGALSVKGKTIAVTGTGIDRIYPSRNRQLAYDIHENGLLISEFALGTSPGSGNFPRRNRVISGLCIATLVVEATRRSGSLITAHQALEQGREVFAIPGSIHNPQARGCHQLIREGAKLVEQASDIIEELASLLGFIAQQMPKPDKPGRPELDHESSKLLETIGYDPVSTDTLVELSGLTIDKLSSMLLVLELNDLIQSAPGSCYVRI